MKTSFFAVMLFAGVPGLGQAASLSPPSHIDAVTVYPRGADVLRKLEVELPAGESTLVLDDVPAGADARSLRVSGTAPSGVQILSVDTKPLVATSDQVDAARQKLADQLAGLADERSRLEQLIGDKQAERKLLLALAEKGITVGTEPGATKVADAGAIDSLVGTVATRLAATSQAIHEAQLRLKAIARETADLTTRLAALAPEKPGHLRVEVHVLAAQAVRGDLAVSYRVAEAGWQAFYDAELALPKAGVAARLELVRRADVEQMTGEDWRNVALTLSTAAPSGTAAMPDVAVSWIAPLQAMPLAKQALRKTADAAKPAAGMADANSALETDPAAEPAAPAPVAQAEAQVQAAGFNAQYVIAGRVDIETSGSAKKVRIGSGALPAALVVESAPRLDPQAYLTAAFTAPEDAPLLAGPVNLFRDQVYVGQTAIGALAPGAEARLGFGVDELVQVRRSEAKRLAASEGLIRTSTTQQMGWVIDVTNLHDSPMPVRIVDRKPVASDSRIVVTDLAGTTAPSVTDLDHKPGVLAWDLNLAPKGKAEIITGYKVAAPEGLALLPVD